MSGMFITHDESDHRILLGYKIVTSTKKFQSISVRSRRILISCSPQLPEHVRNLPTEPMGTYFDPNDVYCIAVLSGLPDRYGVSFLMGVISSFLNSTSEPSACNAILPLLAVQL